MLSPNPGNSADDRGREWRGGGLTNSRWRERADEASRLDLEEGWVTQVLGESGTARMQEPLTGRGL